MTVSDRDLFHLIQTDNQRAFKELMNRYWRPMYLMAESVLSDSPTSEDIVQDVFINIWNKRSSIDITHSIKVYLFACTRYQIYRQIQQKKAPHVDIDQFSQLVPDPYDPQQALEYRDLLDRLESLIDQLPPRCREVYRLKREDNLSQKEIAEALQISRKSVENQLTIALKKLRAGLSRYIWLSTFLLSTIGGLI